MSRTYDADFYSWANDQADALKRRSANELDWDNLAEELGTMGASEENELHSRYVVLLQHLLKWIHQPENRGASWRATIAEQRRAIRRRLRRSPGLKSREADEFLDAYGDARLRAFGETGLELALFPEAPAFTMDEAKDENWWPE